MNWSDRPRELTALTIRSNYSIYVWVWGVAAGQNRRSLMKSRDLFIPKFFLPFNVALARNVINRVVILA